jgi:hypothetical protein
MNKNIDGVGEVQVPATPKEKLQNFWYHYKWHSIVAAVVIVALLVCTLQFCGKTKYDSYILYAGSKNIGRTASDGDVAEISTVISSLKRISKDFDGDGTVNVNFTNYYYLSAEEAEGQEINDALLASDTKALSSVLEHSDYYLLFISEAVYEKYHKVGNGELFIDVNDYIYLNTDAVYYAPNAIRLSSLDAYKLPGLAVLPEDTLICIRYPSSIGGKSKDHQKYFENAKEMLVNILEVNID